MVSGRNLLVKNKRTRNKKISPKNIGTGTLWMRDPGSGKNSSWIRIQG
jgi:hypothetical protein